MPASNLTVEATATLLEDIGTAVKKIVQETLPGMKVSVDVVMNPKLGLWIQLAQEGDMRYPRFIKVGRVAARFNDFADTPYKRSLVMKELGLDK